MSGPVDQPGARRKILVLGIGNPDRGDDAVGAIVAQKLDGRLPADATLLVRSGDMLSLIDEWAGFEALVCVDAAAPMGSPGRVHRIDLATDDLPQNVSLTSSHAFSVVDAIRLARALKRAPRDIIVFAVEGRCFDRGAPVTEAIEASADEVTRRVIAEVARLRRNGMKAAPHG